MAKILADRDIKRLVGRVLVDADENLLNPNGIELRLGKHVRFHSTGFKGVLNWGLRNGSIQKLTLQYGEPIFKLTLFALDRDESPDIAYGEQRPELIVEREPVLSG